MVAVRAVAPVFAVKLNGGSREPVRPRTIFDVISASLAIVALHGIQRGLAAADMIAAPELGHASYRNLSKVDELVAAGERSAREALAAAP